MSVLVINCPLCLESCIFITDCNYRGWDLQGLFEVLVPLAGAHTMLVLPPPAEGLNEGFGKWWVRLGSNTFNFCISSVIAQNTSVPVLQPESALLHHWQYWSWPAVVLVVSWVSVVPLVLRSKGRAERGLCTFICCTRGPCVCDFPLCPSLQVLRQVMAEVSVKTNLLHCQLLQTILTMGDVWQT